MLLRFVIVCVLSTALSCSKEVNYEDRTKNILQKIDRTEWYSAKIHGQVSIAFDGSDIILKTGKVMGIHSKDHLIAHQTFDFAILELDPTGTPMMMGLKLMNNKELRILIWKNATENFSYEQIEDIIISKGNKFSQKKRLFFF